MSTHPYIPLYVDDYDAATAHLTVEEDGVYSRLIRLCWRTPGCSLPNDPAWIARKIRISADDYVRIAKPVIEEFFKVLRGRLIQKRLKAEYDDISRKKSARANAGKKGGAAKALKTGDLSSSNATGLPPDTGASPEPKPEPEIKKETPSPQGGEVDLKRFAKALLITSDAGMPLAGLVDLVHQLQPVVEERRRSTRPDVERALGGALRRGNMPSQIVAAVRAYYALPASTKDGGQYASGAAVILNKDRWKEFASPASGLLPLLTVAAFNGPAELRASVVRVQSEDFARAWIDTAVWRAGDRTLLARNAFGLSTLQRELGDWARRNNVNFDLAAANDTPQQSEQAA